jgi:hypothetical protein
MKYQVIIRERVRREFVIVVDAEDAAAARQKALDEADVAPDEAWVEDEGFWDVFDVQELTDAEVPRAP